MRHQRALVTQSDLPVLACYQLRQASRNTELAFSATQEENLKLRQAYMDICGEADALHAVSFGPLFRSVVGRCC